MFSKVHLAKVKEGLAEFDDASGPCPVDFVRVHFAREKELKCEKDKSRAYELKIRTNST